MPLVVIPIGHIIDIASGRAFRRFRAEQELRGLWVLASPQERVEWIRHYGSSTDPGERQLAQLFASFAVEDRDRERGRATNAKFTAWLLRWPVVRLPFIALLFVSGPYLFFFPSMSALMGLSRKAAITGACVSLAAWGLLIAVLAAQGGLSTAG